VNNFSQVLRQKGYRLTSQRQQILNALTDHPQSVEEVVAVFKQNRTTVDKVTVYRTLDCFVDLGIVAKTQFRDKTAKYELLNQDNHHHHLVCDNCGSVRDIALNEQALIKQVSQGSDFQVKSHSLEFFGLCANCQ
jgi:Fur family ferric uptake transcriptional regulator